MPHMTSGGENFDIFDPYDAAVLWHIFLECADCGQIDEFPADPEDATIADSLPHYHTTAQRARESGWYVVDRGKIDEAAWHILCPLCCSRRGLAMPDAAATLSPAALAFYRATTGRSL